MERWGRLQCRQGFGDPLLSRIRPESLFLEGFQFGWQCFPHSCSILLQLIQQVEKLSMKAKNPDLPQKDSKPMSRAFDLLANLPKDMFAEARKDDAPLRAK
jgi:hypothetical protein